MSGSSDQHLLTGPQARSWLKLCAHGERPSFITVFDNGSIYRATLVAAQRTLTFHLADPIEPAPLQGTVCSVYVHLEGASASFLGHTLAYTLSPEEEPRLSLSVPQAIATIETRRAFRIPADEETPVRVVATAPDLMLTGTLTTVSRMGLSFATDAPVTADRSTLLVMHLSWPGGEATAEGRIAHLTPDTCRVAFEPATDLAASGLASLVSWQQRSQLQRRGD